MENERKSINKSIIKTIFMIILYLILYFLFIVIFDFIPSFILHSTSSLCCSSEYFIEEMYRNIFEITYMGIIPFIATILSLKILMGIKKTYDLKIINIFSYVCLILTGLKNLIYAFNKIGWLDEYAFRCTEVITEDWVQYAFDNCKSNSIMSIYFILFTLVLLIVNTLWFISRMKKLKTSKNS